MKSNEILPKSKSTINTVGGSAEFGNHVRSCNKLFMRHDATENDTIRIK